MQIVNGTIYLRGDHEQGYRLQLGDHVVASAPHGLTLREAKIWAHGYVQGHWKLKPRTGIETNAYDLCEGRADAGSGSYHNGDAWIIQKDGHILYSNDQIPADDRAAGGTWIETAIDTWISARSVHA